MRTNRRIPAHCLERRPGIGMVRVAKVSPAGALEGWCRDEGLDDRAPVGRDLHREKSPAGTEHPWTRTLRTNRQVCVRNARSQEHGDRKGPHSQCLQIRSWKVPVPASRLPGHRAVGAEGPRLVVAASLSSHLCQMAVKKHWAWGGAGKHAPPQRGQPTSQ